MYELSGQCPMGVLGMVIMLCSFVLLIICVSLLAKIINILKELKAGLKAPVSREPAPVTVPVNNTAIIAAITAAVYQYRKENS